MQQSMFADAAARILSSASAAPLDGFDRALWDALAEAGLDRLLLPEALDGAGDALDEAAAVMVAFGAAGASVPLGESIVANWCLAHAGLDVPPGPKALLIEPEQDGLTISGRDLFWRGETLAPWAPAAAAIVAVAPGKDGRMRVGILSELPAGTVGETLAGEPALGITAGAAGLPLAALGELESDGQLPLALAALMQAAAIAGAIGRACELTVDYANTRKQFGRSISRFQAVQHMAARMASESAAATAAVEFASEGPLDNLLWRAALAKSRASEAAGVVAADAHQIHGAIGFTREYELHRHTRRLWAWRERFGNESYWNTRIGQAALCSDSETLWPDLVRGMQL